MVRKASSVTILYALLRARLEGEQALEVIA